MLLNDYDKAKSLMSTEGATLYVQLSTRPIYDRFTIYAGNIGTSVEPAVARRLRQELGLVTVSESVGGRGKTGAFKELAAK